MPGLDLDRHGKAALGAWVLPYVVIASTMTHKRATILVEDLPQRLTVILHAASELSWTRVLT